MREMRVRELGAQLPDERLGVLEPRLEGVDVAGFVYLVSRFPKGKEGEGRRNRTSLVAGVSIRG